MGKASQCFSNQGSAPIYVSVEPCPECFKLMPKEELTLRWHPDPNHELARIEWINDKELVVWPNGNIDDIEFLIDGEEARHKAWNFDPPD
ncbi:MAG: hypothetical protein AAGL10_07900 [Pseudomonadota bacterium]